MHGQVFGLAIELFEVPWGSMFVNGTSLGLIVSINSTCIGLWRLAGTLQANTRYPHSRRFGATGL